MTRGLLGRSKPCHFEYVTSSWLKGKFWEGFLQVATLICDTERVNVLNVASFKKEMALIFSWLLKSNLDCLISFLNTDSNANVVKIGLYSILILHVKHLTCIFIPEWLTTGHWQRQRPYLPRFRKDGGCELILWSRRSLAKGFCPANKKPSKIIIKKKTFLSLDEAQDEQDAWCKLCEISDTVTQWKCVFHVDYPTKKDRCRSTKQKTQRWTDWRCETRWLGGRKESRVCSVWQRIRIKKYSPWF